MNRQYGKLENGKIQFAPKTLTIKNRIVSKPTHQDYLDCGYKLVVNVYPEEGKDNVEFSHFNVVDDRIEVHFVKKEEVQTFKISKLKLRVVLQSLGLWWRVREWMEKTTVDTSNIQLSVSFDNAIPVSLYDLYQEAQIIDTSDPMFAPFLDEARKIFGNEMSEEQIVSIFKQCEA